MSILVTGASSGLGKFLAERLKAETLNRGDSIPDKSYNLIIHCAYDHKAKDELSANIDLLEKVLCIPHEYFIHISSVDVYQYPKESDYPKVKLELERLVRSSSDSYCIMRVGWLIGKYMRYNNFVKMFTGDKMTLSENSAMCFTTYEQVLQYVQKKQIFFEKSETVTLASGRTRLSDIAKRLGLEPKWGKIDNIACNISATVFDDIRGLQHIVNQVEKDDNTSVKGKASKA